MNQWFRLAAKITSTASSYKFTAWTLVSQWGFLLKKLNLPTLHCGLQTAPAPWGAVITKETWTSGCDTAVLPHARRLFLRILSLTHHTWVFIYILFLFSSLGNVNSLFGVTDCSDSVPTQLKTNTLHCRVWMSETWLLDANWREIKSLGQTKQNMAS